MIASTTHHFSLACSSPSRYGNNSYTDHRTTRHVGLTPTAFGPWRSRATTVPISGSWFILCLTVLWSRRSLVENARVSMVVGEWVGGQVGRWMAGGGDSTNSRMEMCMDTLSTKANGSVPHVRSRQHIRKRPPRKRKRPNKRQRRNIKKQTSGPASDTSVASTNPEDRTPLPSTRKFHSTC